MNQGFDYLVMVSCGVMRDSARENNQVAGSDDPSVDKLRSQLREDNEGTAEILGRVVELNWCVYDVKKQIITETRQKMVKGDDFTVTPETFSKNKLTLNKFDGAQQFNEIISDFNDYAYMNFTRANKSFCFVSNGDTLMTRILPREAQLQQMKLPSHFFSYFDIALEFKKNFPHAISIKTLPEMLLYTNLQEKPLLDQSISQFEISNIVRLSNLLIRSGYVFALPVSKPWVDEICD